MYLPHFYLYFFMSGKLNMLPFRVYIMKRTLFNVPCLFRTILHRLKKIFKTVSLAILSSMATYLSKNSVLTHLFV